MQVVEMVRELGSNGRAVKSKFGKFRGGQNCGKPGVREYGIWIFSAHIRNHESILI